MQFGVCCSLDQAPMAILAGFDYVELPAGQLFAGSAEPDYERLQRVHLEATNLFVAGDLKLVGPERGDVRGYAETVIPRAAKAGVETMVIGSGAARRSPAGYDLDAAEDDFLRAAVACQEVASEFGITIAPESLVPAETNVGNFLGDLARLLRFRGIAYTADSYHVLNQPAAAPVEAWYWETELPFKPAHVHLATAPRSWRVDASPELGGFVNRLWELEYDGRVSLECIWGNFEEEIVEARERVGRLFASAH